MRILAYHEISDTPADPRHNVRPAAFREQMHWLADHGYTTGNLGEEPADPKVVGIMFDDGYQDFYHQAWPVLDDLGFTATVFVITDRVGEMVRWYAGERAVPLLDWSQIQELARHGVQFGSHTHTHSDLTTLDRERLHQELRMSRRRLEEALGLPSELFSYPFSRVNPAVARGVQEAGYRYAFRFCPFHPAMGADPYGAFRGTAVLDGDDIGAFEQKLRGSAQRWVRWRLRQLRAVLRGRPLPDC